MVSRNRLSTLFLSEGEFLIFLLLFFFSVLNEFANFVIFILRRERRL